MKSNKKGAFEDLARLLTGLGTLAILAAIIFLIIAEAQDQIVAQGPCDNSTLVFNESDQLCYDAAESDGGGASYAYNSSLQVQSAASDIPGWLPIVVVTVIGGVLLMLVRFFRRT